MVSDSFLNIFFNSHQLRQFCKDLLSEAPLWLVFQTLPQLRMEQESLIIMSRSSILLATSFLPYWATTDTTNTSALEAAIEIFQRAPPRFSLATVWTLNSEQQEIWVNRSLLARFILSTNLKRNPWTLRISSFVRAVIDVDLNACEICFLENDFYSWAQLTP